MWKSLEYQKSASEIILSTLEVLFSRGRPKDMASGLEDGFRIRTSVMVC